MQIVTTVPPGVTPISGPYSSLADAQAALAYGTAPCGTNVWKGGPLPDGDLLAFSDDTGALVPLILHWDGQSSWSGTWLGQSGVLTFPGSPPVATLVLGGVTYQEGPWQVTQPLLAAYGLTSDPTGYPGGVGIVGPLNPQTGGLPVLSIIPLCAGAPTPPSSGGGAGPAVPPPTPPSGGGTVCPAPVVQCPAPIVNVTVQAPQAKRTHAPGVLGPPDEVRIDSDGRWTQIWYRGERADWERAIEPLSQFLRREWAQVRPDSEGTEALALIPVPGDSSYG